MRFASLGSGSNGNALLIEARSSTTTTRILLDCGFSVRATEKKLARLATNIHELHAILITHEHADHIGSAFALASKARIPIFMSWGTAQATQATAADIDLRILSSEQKIAIGDLEVSPYTVPHDAREPLQYVVSNGLYRLGVLTDAGSKTPIIINQLNGCHGLILECNHDKQMLEQGRYPPALKARISSAYGHLANNTAANILDTLDRSQIKHVVAAHLSNENNRPDLARAALANALSTKAADIIVATQSDGFPWLTL